MHFFSRDLTPQRFGSMIAGLLPPETEAALGQSYLGFMVIRPLDRFVARTCLKFNATQDWKLPLRHAYQVGLFGLPLTVSDTVAFQEQDTVVAACATCAVWFALNAVGDGQFVPSPGSITRQAMHDNSMPLRVFPNRGLDTEMIVRALKRENYEVVVKDFKALWTGAPEARTREQDIKDVKQIIYAYLRGGIAAPILGVELYEKEPESSAYAFFARHAVTVLGYKLSGQERCKPEGEFRSPRLLADNIDAFLVHDDQVGPFCEMPITEDEKPIRINGSELNVRGTLRHPLAEFRERPVLVGGRNPANILQLPTLVSFATYHKIRAQFEDVVHYVDQLEKYVLEVNDKEMNDLLFGADSTGFVWDLYVSSSTSAKAEVRECLRKAGRYERGALRAKILSVVAIGWPRYLWRATAYRDGDSSGTPVFDLIIDATDTVQIRSLLMPIFYCEKTEEVFRGLFAPDEGDRDPYWDTHQPSPLVSGLARHFEVPHKIQELDADHKYGVAEPPRWIKPHEKSQMVVLNQQSLSWTKDRCFIIPEGALSQETQDDGERPVLERLADFLAEIQGKPEGCIWLIDEWCNLIIGEDAPSIYLDTNSPKLGHPTLIGGKPARISGELTPPQKPRGKWRLTNASGRYSRLRTDRGEEQLSRACELIERRCEAIGLKLEPQWRPDFGLTRIIDAVTADREISDLAGRDIDYQDQVEMLRELAQETAEMLESEGKGDTISGTLLKEVTLALSEVERLKLHFLERLWNLLPGTVPAAAHDMLVPVIEVFFANVAKGGGKSAAIPDLELFASLVLLLHESGNERWAEISAASDWVETLSRSLLARLKMALQAQAEGMIP